MLCTRQYLQGGLWPHLGPDRPTLSPMCSDLPHTSTTSGRALHREPHSGDPEPRRGDTLRRLF